MKPISFTSHGYKLAGHFFTPVTETQQLAFLLIQGWTGHENLQAAQALADMGYVAMTYDMRGNGNSEGDIANFTRSDFIEDSEVAYDYLCEQVGPDVAIGVIGSSFGSYTAVLLSLKRPIYCLSLRVPASYPDEGFDDPQLAQGDPDDFITWRKQSLSYNENMAFGALHDFEGLVQIIEAEADEMVPRQAVQNYAAAMADPTKLTYEVVPNAPHRLANAQLKADYETRLINWVKLIEGKS